MAAPIDWSQPQRQPFAGLAIIVLKTFWEVVKRAWPVVLIALFRDEGEQEQGGWDKVEGLIIIISALALLAGVFRFFYFRFYILNGELIVKKGWLKKETLVIPLARIQTVHIEQSLLHEALHIVRLTIDTAGSTKAEVAIDALRKGMAEALRTQLLEAEKDDTKETAAPAFREPLLSLSGRDLFRLSLSANHLEAFFILLSFAIGVYDNVSRINKKVFSDAEGAVLQSSLTVLLFLATAVLVLVFVISTARIVFRFFDFTVFPAAAGYRIRSGLTNVKERIVAFRKIQYVSWKANWIRRLMRLWMLEYHVAGGDEAKVKMKVQVPVTREGHIPALAQNYQPLPDPAGREAVRIHPAYALRRLMFGGVLPAAALIAVTWIPWGNKSLFFLLLPLWVGISALLYQRKFRLWTFGETLLIRNGVLGEGYILLAWYKLQAVTLKQSLYQRNNDLASVHLHTASGSITIPYIPLHTAEELVNYSLYEMERTQRPWM